MPTEPVFDIACLGHVELLTPKPEESLAFFVDVLGMCETCRAGQSVYLRAFGDYERHTLKLTEAPTGGVGHVAWRAHSPQGLARAVARLERAGCGVGWVAGDQGHDAAYRFTDPDGHLMEVYWEAERFAPGEGERAYLKNQPQRYPNRGASVRRLDHVNVLCAAVTPSREFMQDALGFRARELVVLDDGTEAGAWLSVTPLVHDIAYTLDATRSRGRLHHIAYWLDNREDVLRCADLCLEHGVPIETGPAKHAVSQGFFLYMYEPGGNRVEVISGGYLILAPDWEPVVWTQAERARGQAWGLQLPKTFHTYGTPDVRVEDGELREIPVFDVE